MSVTPPTGNPKSRQGPLYILGLIVLILVAAGAIYAWHSTQKTTNVNSSTGTVAIPSDFKEYKATKYGFKFNYPKEWSNPSINETAQSSTKQIEIVFNPNNQANYLVDATLQPDVANTLPLKASIQKQLSGKSKGFFRQDGSSYATVLNDPVTKAPAQVNIWQIVNLPKLKVSIASVEIMLSPSNKCPAGKLADTEGNGCLTESDYSKVTIFTKSIRPL